MKCSKLLLILSGLLLIQAAEQNVKNNHKSHHLQEKFHRRKAQQEKSAVHNFVIPYKKSELRSQNLHNFHRLVYRSGNSDCSWMCKNGTYYDNLLGLQVYYNGNEHLVGLVNQSNNIALIIDYSSNVAALLNGQTEDTIIANLNSGTIYRTRNGTQANVAWLASKSSFETYFQSLSSLQGLLTLGQQSGEKYNFGNIDQPFVNEILDELNNLGILRLFEAVIDVISRFVPFQYIRQFVHYVKEFYNNLPSLQSAISSVLLRANEILSSSSNVLLSLLSNIPIIGSFFADIVSSNIPQYLNLNYVAAVINNTNSSEILSRLLPGVDLRNLTNIEDILPTIFHSANLTEILLNSSNVSSVLSHIPFVGDIFRTFNISHYLNPNYFTENFIQILSNLLWNVWDTTNEIASEDEREPFWDATSGISYGIEGGFGGVLRTFAESVRSSSGRKVHHRFQDKKQHSRHHQHH